MHLFFFLFFPHFAPLFSFISIYNSLNSIFFAPSVLSNPLLFHASHFFQSIFHFFCSFNFFASGLFFCFWLTFSFCVRMILLISNHLKWNLFKIQSQTSFAHGLYDDALFRTDTDLISEDSSDEFREENVGSKRKYFNFSYESLLWLIVHESWIISHKLWVIIISYEILKD